MRVRAAMALASAATFAGCTHSHLPRNAPGVVDVRQDPEDPGSRSPEAPEDPGERMLIFGYGAFAGGGVLIDDSTDPDFGIGPELSLDLGERRRSHYEDDFFVLPDRSLGLRLGLVALDGELKPPGPVFGELSYAEHLVRASGGWAYDPDDARHGPQLTLAFGPLYLRGTHLLDYGTAVHVGLVIQGNHAWVWSR